MVEEYELKHRAFVLLGLVNEKMHEGGCHAYDINKRIEDRGMRNWTSIGADFSFSTIYRTLDRLENDELVESYEEQIDGRTRKMYQISNFGYEILRKKVYEVLYNYSGENDRDFYVAFSMFPILILEEQIEVFTHSLEIIRTHRKELKKMLEEMLEGFVQMPINVTGLFIHPIEVLKADEKFFEIVIEEIKKFEGKIGPDDYDLKKEEKL